MAPDIDVSKTVITAVIGFLATTLAGWTWTRLRRAAGKEPPKPIEVAPHEEWSKGVIARSFWARSLRGGFHASGGTRVLIIDAGMIQLEFAEGEHDSKEVRNAFDARSVGDNARALQYLTGENSIEDEFPCLQSADPFTDVVCSLETRFQFADEEAKSLLDSGLIRDDRQITEDDLRATIKLSLSEWISGEARGLPFSQLHPDFNANQAVARELARKHFSECSSFRFYFAFRSVQGEEFGLRKANVLNTAELDLKRAENERNIEEWRIEYEKLLKELDLRKSLVEQLKKITEYDERIFFLRQNVKGVAFFKAQEEEFRREQAATNFQTKRAQALEEIRRKASSSQTGLVELTTPSVGDLRTRDLAPQPQHSIKIMRPGEPLRIRVRSGISGYLTLLNMGTSGALNVILPNRWEPSRRINGGEVIEVPGCGYVITNLALTPLGPDIVQGFVTPEPMFQQPVSDNFASYPASEMMARVRDLCARLPSSSWGEAAITIHVQ